MRFTLTALALLTLLACSDDEPGEAAVTTSSSPSTTCADDAAARPEAVDGTPAEIVASVGDLRFAIVDRGASVDVVSIYRSVDCTLEPLLLDGSSAALAVGGSVTHGDGIRCHDGEITVLSATSDDGSTFQSTSTTYGVEGSELVQRSTRSGTIEAAEDPDALGAHYRLDC